MDNQVMKNEMMKSCSKCGIVKKRRNIYFRNTNQKYRSEYIQCRTIKQNQGRKKSMKKIRVIKNNILKVIQKNYAINRKSIMMRIVM